MSSAYTTIFPLDTTQVPYYYISATTWLHSPLALVMHFASLLLKVTVKILDLSGSYRGIALTLCFSRVVELCVLEMYGEHLLTSELQFGFKPGALVCSKLLFHGRVQSLWLSSKAFDTVDHTILLDKLLSRVYLMEWCASFLEVPVPVFAN